MIRPNNGQIYRAFGWYRRTLVFPIRMGRDSLASTEGRRVDGMTQWNVYGKVVGSKFLGTFEAETEDDAVEKALKKTAA